LAKASWLRNIMGHGIITFLEYLYGNIMTPRHQGFNFKSTMNKLILIFIQIVVLKLHNRLKY
jgi:hypothetical protein